MQNDGKTEYANSGNTADGEETLYVRGGNAIEENQTEYVGKECSEKIDSEKQRKEDSADNEPIEEEKQETEAYFLPINTILLKRYRIDGVLGQGGFGITYLGWDITLNTSVAIKEFFPSGLATRSVSIGRTTQVVPIISSRKEEDFRDGVRRVLDEARKMARFRNTPGIVGVYDFFEANNTAYIVMEYVDGCTLDKFYKEKQIDDISLFNRLVPVMDALQALHKEGILHRDISPDNIMVDKEENFKLLDFGAARGYQEGPSASMSVILKRNYAPIEQFSTKGNQGPWTDVYALGATIYSLLTGKNVPESVDRLIEDDIVDIRELDGLLSDKQAAAIMKALAVHKEDRWESVEEFKNALICDTRRNETGKNDDFKELKTVEKSEKKKGVLLACTLLIVLAIIAFFVRESVKNTNRKVSVTTETSEKENSSNENTFEKDDLSIELVDAEIDKYSSDRLHLLLRFNNPNDTCSVIIDSLSINGVEVSDFKKIEGVLGEKESTKEVKVDYPNVIAQQVGECIRSLDVQYRYEGEYDVERYCSQSGYSYSISSSDLKENEYADSASTTDDLLEEKGRTDIQIVDKSTNKANEANKKEIASEADMSKVCVSLHGITEGKYSTCMFLLVENNTNKEVTLDKDWTYLNGTSIVRSSSEGLMELEPYSGAVIKYYFDSSVWSAAKNGKIDKLEVCFYIDGAEESTVFDVTKEGGEKSIARLVTNEEKRMSGATKSKNLEVNLTDIKIGEYSTKVYFNVKNISSSTIELGKSWTYFNGVAVTRASSEGNFVLDSGKASVIEYSYDSSMVNSAIEDEISTLRLQFYVNDTDEPECFYYDLSSYTEK